MSLEHFSAVTKGQTWDSLPQLHNSERAILSYLASEIPPGVPNAPTPLNRKQLARRLGLSSRTVLRAVQYLSAREAPARRGDVGYLPGKGAQDQPLVAKAPILLLEDQRGKPGRHREVVRIQWSSVTPISPQVVTSVNSSSRPSTTEPPVLASAATHDRWSDGRSRKEAPSGWGAHREAIAVAWKGSSAGDEKLAEFYRWTDDDIRNVVQRAEERGVDPDALVAQAVQATQPPAEFRTQPLTPRAIFGTPEALQATLDGKYRKREVDTDDPYHRAMREKAQAFLYGERRRHADPDKGPPILELEEPRVREQSAEVRAHLESYISETTVTSSDDPTEVMMVRCRFQQGTPVLELESDHRTHRFDIITRGDLLEQGRNFASPAPVSFTLRGWNVTSTEDVQAVERDVSRIIEHAKRTPSVIPEQSDVNPDDPTPIPLRPSDLNF